LDIKRLINQLAALEATATGTKVDHIRGQHDDCANVCAGALVLASTVPLNVIPLVAPIVVSGGPRNFP
jgi:hypothetical protein